MIKTIKNTTGVFNIYVFINAGVIYEAENEHGISHMLEHMLFKQTKNLSNKDILETTTRFGGVINAATDKDVTFYYFKTTSEKYEKAIRLMAELIMNPKFSSKDLESERKVVLEELNKGKDNDDRFMWHMSTLSVLPFDHVYGKKVIGTEESLLSLTVHDLNEYYKTHYNNPLVVISCDSKVKASAESLVKRLFFKKPTVQTNPPCISYELSRKVLVFSKDMNQNTLVLTFPIFEKHIDLRTVMLLEFMSYVLTGAGLYALLTYELREKRGLVYNVASFNENMKNISFFKLVLASTQSDFKMLLDIILTTLKRIQKNGLTDKEFKLYKDGFWNVINMSLAYDDFETLLIGMHTYNTDGKENVNTVILKDIIKSISNKDVMTIAKKVFDMKCMGVVCVGSFGEAQKYSDELLAYIDGKYV